MFGSDTIQELSRICWFFYSQIFPILIITVSLALFNYIPQNSLFIHNVVFYYTENCHFEAELFPDDTRNHDARRVHQKHQRVVQDFETTQTSGCTYRCRSFGCSIFFLQIRNTPHLVNYRRFSHIRSPTSHQPKSHLFILMLIVIFEISQHFAHIVMFLRTDRETFDPILIVIRNNFICFDLITQIVFIEDYYFLLLVLFDDEIKLWIPTTVRYSCVSDLEKHVNFVTILLYQSQCFFHMTWEPVYMFLYRSDNLHLNYNFNNNKQMQHQTKYSGHSSHSTHMHRTGGSTSPLRTTTKGKYYSADEVYKMMKTNFEPKIQYLMQELEDRQQIIARLNNQLNQNDQKLEKQKSLIEGYARKKGDPSQMHSFVISTVNQLINDKTKQFWETIMGQLKQVTTKMEKQLDFKRIQALVQHEMHRLKASVNEFMETNKKKSNTYWLKIKDALSKVNGKIVSIEKSISQVNNQLENFRQKSTKDRQIIDQLQNSKHVAKNLLQLRKSVDNIYDNYQAVLNLQKGLKMRLEEQHADSIWHEPDFFKVSSKLVMPNEEIVLEYSREEMLNDKEPFDDEWKPHENVTQPMVSPLKNSKDYDRSSSDILGLQKTTPLKSNHENSELFSLNTSNQMHSKIHNSTILLNFSLETRKQMAQEAKQRLLQLIEAKNLSRPLEVRYDDQIHYLKNTEGNYLFDMKGNMFKIPPSELAKLEEEGILARNKSKRKVSLSNSKVKRTNC